MTYTPAQVEKFCRTLIPGYDPWRDAGDCIFQIDLAMRVVEFFTSCLHFTNGEWAGKPFELQPFQAAVLGNIFGWTRPDGTRRYRKVFLFEPKKGGKTELIGGLANYLLFADSEPTPELVAAAANAEQASILFRAASRMVELEPELANRAEVMARAIRCTMNGGTFRVVNSAAKSKHGGNLHAALIDELFAIENPALVDALETSMAARKQPLLIYLTTAGESLECVGGEVYGYACRVRDGLITDAEFLPVIYEAGKDDAPGDPATWKKAQPNLNITVQEAVYAKEYQDALAVPRKMSIFRQFRLNQWVAVDSAWIDTGEWRACAGAVDPKPKAACYGGLDLSTVSDTTAFVLAFPDPDGDIIRVKPFIFLPEDSASGLIRRQKRDRAPYELWAKQGHLILTPGSVVDYNFVYEVIMEQAEKYELRELQIDPANANSIAPRLLEAGIDVVYMRQGWSLSEPTKETERRILNKTLVHPNHPVLNWQMSHVVCTEDRHSNYWPTKDRSTSRIDGAVSMIMAINAACFGTHRSGNLADSEDCGFMIV